MNLVTLHPKIVHFPIAFVFLALLFQVLYVWRSDEFFRRAALWVVQIGILAVAVTVASGLLAADTLGHDAPGHDLVHDHRNVMYAVAGAWLALSLALLLLPYLRGPGGRWALLVVLVVLAGGLSYGADMGGDLVYLHATGVRVSGRGGAGGAHEHGVHHHQHGASDHSHGHHGAVEHTH